VMDYEQRRQSFEEPCLAGANSNYYNTVGGLMAYRNQSVDMGKLVLALPYYAHDYLCVDYQQNTRCLVEQHPFRGAKCSSLVAKVIPYNRLTKFLNSVKAIAFWDEHSATAYAMY